MEFQDELYNYLIHLENEVGDYTVVRVDWHNQECFGLYLYNVTNYAPCLFIDLLKINNELGYSIKIVFPVKDKLNKYINTLKCYVKTVNDLKLILKSICVWT